LHFSKNTMYNFSLDKRQVIITAAALAVLTVLIFSAGLLTGMLTRRPAASDQAVKSSETAALMSGTGKTITVDPQTLLTTTPQGLISKVKGEAASEKADLMGKARQPRQIEIGGGSSPAAAEQQLQADGSEIKADSPAAETPTPPPAGDEPKKDGQKNPEKSKSDIRFSVEAESFVLKSKALLTAKELAAKGWDKACVLRTEGTDNDGSIWYVVQIGDYDHLEAAQTAASEFQQKEGVIAGNIRTMTVKQLQERTVSDSSDKESKQ